MVVGPHREHSETDSGKNRGMCHAQYLLSNLSRFSLEGCPTKGKEYKTLVDE
ncbi:MAG: hypothetical protein OEZ68_21815 [Gammaproteobacteria bacterium]|nr:hypothetical protein [Gammaproteobacteria bacterium]MDH5803436.1 hypothetical protein [Gammaproteobacteria bacterium]